MFSFGDASYAGSMAADHVSRPVVGLAPTRGGIPTPPGPAALPLTIVTTTLPPALVGTPYTATLVATGGARPYTWSIKAGTLTDGLTLDSTTGVISGTPTAPTVEPLTIAVTDEHGGLATSVVTLAVGLAPGQVGPGHGTLAVSVGQLPAGLAASVTVSGPSSFATQMAASGDLQVPPGLYSVSATPVSDGADTYYPTVTGSPATVVARQTTVVGVSYLTTVPATSKVLSASDLADLTSAPSDQSSLAFSWTGDEPLDLAGLQDGDVVTAAPSATLPTGLLARITSMAVDGNTLVVTTAHAGLVQAVSQGEFDVTGSTATLSRAELSELVSRNVVRPHGKSSVGCLADGSVSLQLTAPTFSITPHFDASWSVSGGFQADAYITVVESVGYQAKINGGVACQYTYAIVPKSPLTDIPIPLGPVTIVITPVIEVDLTAKAEADATFTESGTQGFTWQVGASYAGGQLSGISNLTPQNSPNPGTDQATGYVKVSLGPKLTFNIGLIPWVPKAPLIGPYIGVDGFLKVQVGQTAPTWAVAFGIEATVGFQASWSFGIFSIGLNAQLTIPIVTVTIAASPPVVKDPPRCPATQTGCSGFVLPTIETGTLLQPYTYQLVAQGYTGSGSSITSGFNVPSGSISAAIGGTACSANAPAGTMISLTTAAQPANDALLTVSGLPLSFAASNSYLFIPVTLTDVLGTVSDVCLSAPVVPGVHSASFPLPGTEADIPYNDGQGYQIPMTTQSQGGNGSTYTCPNYPVSLSAEPEDPITLHPVGDGPQFFWAAPTLQIATVAQGGSSFCQVNGYVEQNDVPWETASSTVFAGPTTQQLQVNDGVTTTDCWISGRPCDSLVLPTVSQHVQPLLAATLVAEQGVPFYFQPQVAGGQDPYSWSAVAPDVSQAYAASNSVQASFDGCYAAAPGEGLPPGVTMADTSTGTLSGTPTAAGTYNVPMTVSDGLQGLSCGYQEIQVMPALSLTPTTLPSAEVGGSYATGLISATVTGGRGPYHYSIGGVTPGTPLPSGSFEELPPGLSLDPNTGFITGSVAPGIAPGTYSVPVVVSDDVDVRASAIDTIDVQPPPQITSPDILPSAVLGKVYAGVTLSATGGTPGPMGYTWTVTSGALPAGVGLLGDGALIGIPCTGVGTPASSCPGAARTASALVTVTDALGSTDSRYVTVPVGPAISTRTLPEGELGMSYQAPVDAQGGTAPYTWSTLGTLLMAPSSHGSEQWVPLRVPLPPGLAFASTSSTAQRILRGIPARAGTYAIKLMLHDSSGAAWPAVLKLVVAPQAAIAAQLPTADVGVAYSAVVQADGGVAPFTWTPTSLDGLSLASDGTLSGSPLQTGQYSVPVDATDHDSASAKASIALTVVADPTVTTATLPVAAPGVPYAATLHAVGGTPRSGVANSLGTCGVTASSGQATGSSASATSGCTAAGSTAASPYLWSLGASDKLPAGLSLDPETGAITGTPAPAAPGTSTTLHLTATDAWNASATATLVLAVGTPLAVATTELPAAEVNVPYAVMLEAAGGNAGYRWTSGPLPSGLSLDSSTGTISGTPAQSETSDQVALCVSDQTGAQACHTFALTVAPTLAVATASLPSAEEGKPYTPYTLLAAGGEPGYTWSAAGADSSGYPLPGWLSISSTGVLTGTPPASAGGTTYTVPVQVADDLGGTATTSLTLSVAGSLGISSSILPEGEVGRPYETTIQASGGVPFSSARQSQYDEWFLSSGSLPSGLSLGSTTGQITGTVTTGGAATYDFTVEVEDSLSDIASANLSIAIEIGPSVGTQGLPPAPVGSTYSAQLQANNGVTPYTWLLAAGSALPTWLQLSASGLLSGTPSAADVGHPSFTVQVTDADGGIAMQTLSVAVTAAPLTITTPASLPAATPGQRYDEVVSASGGYPPYDWYVVSSLLPAWLHLAFSNGTYALTGTPPQSAAGTTDTFDLEVQDSTGAPSAVTRTFTLAIGAPTMSITTASLPEATGSQYYDQTLAADGGNGSYSWSVPSGASLPAWLSLSPGGVLSGTPPAAAAGTTVDITVQVSDTEPTPQHTTATLSLAVAPGPITITTTSPLPQATSEAAYSATLAADGGNGSYSWSVPSGASLPAWLSLSTGGVLSGTPPAAAAGTTVDVTVQVSDTEPAPQHTTATLSLAIGAAPPTITTTSPLPSATVGAAYSATLTATGGMTPYVWRFQIESFHPAWLSLSSTGVLSGIPPISAAGRSFLLHVQVSDAANNSSTASLSLPVVGAPVSITTVSPLPSATVGAAYSATLAAAGGNGSYAWSVPSGASLPAWLSLSPGGVLSGTPPDTAAGTTVDVTVAVSDSEPAPQTATATLSLAVSAPTSGPTLHAVSFPSPVAGWAVGDSGTILVTTSMGSTWSHQTSGTTENLLAVFFADSTHGWAVGEGGTILATTDGGTTWTAQTSITGTSRFCNPYPNCDYLQGVAFNDDLHGIIVGTWGTILTTSDGGVTWTVVSGSPPGSSVTPGSYSLNAVAYTAASSSTAYAVGTSGTILETTDGGATWSAQASGTTVLLTGVAFAGVDGFAVGAGGTILATTDGGSTWSPQVSGTGDNLTSVAIGGYCPATGFCVLAAGAAGTVLEQSSAGSTPTWTTLAPVTSADLNGIALLSYPPQYIVVGSGSTTAIGYTP